MIRAALLLAALLAAAASSANDGRIGPFNVYTIDGRFADPDRTSTLHRIDPESGEVLETIGDTGLRLNAITLWPPTSSVIGVTAADDPRFPDHLVEVDPESATTRVLMPLLPLSGQVPPGADLPSDFRDIAVFRSRYSSEPFLLGLIERGSDSDLFERLLWESSIDPITEFPSGQLREMNQGNFQNGLARSGLFGLAAADWYERPIPPSRVYLDLVTIGCTDTESFVEEPPFTLPITPPPLPVGAGLSHPACFAAALRTGVNQWLGVQSDFAENSPRRLTRIVLEPWEQSPLIDQAALEDLGALPDNTVGIALGPAFSVEPVPALSRLGLIVLLAFLSFVAVFRLRARA